MDFERDSIIPEYKDKSGVEEDFARHATSHQHELADEVATLIFDYDVKDPSTWTALMLDQSVPLDPEVKMAYIKSASSRCRQFFLPVIRPFLHLLVGLIQVLKLVLPRRFRAGILLHKIIGWSLHKFVTPEANFLILRHFHLGTQALDFLSRNLGVRAPLMSLYPMTTFDLAPNMILQHDINLYNFVIHLNAKGPLNIAQRDDLDFSDIHRPEVNISDFPNNWTNVLDLETAMEMIAPLFQLLTTDDEYWRASISLQLDESICVYFSKLVGQPERLFMVNNKHPLVANSIVEAPRRLVMHGLSTEMVHKYLLDRKNDF